MKNSGVEWIGEIPDEWEVSKIFWLIDFINGYAFEGSSLSLDLDVPVIRIGNITDNRIDYESCLLYKEDKMLEEYSPYEGDILIAMSGATTGKIGIATNRKAYINQRVGIIRSVYNFFLKYHFQLLAFEEYIRLLSAGSAQSNISMKQIQDFIIPLPPKETQQRIASYLDKKCSKIEETTQNQQQVIEKLKAYKQSLITEAVTGKVKIANGKVCGEYESYKDSGVEWIGKIPSGWILSKFKFISNEIGDGLHGTPNFDESGDIYFLNGTNIGKEKLIFKDDTDRINSLEYEKYKHPLLSKYTIFIALNGATYGKTSFYNNEKVLLGKSAGYITFEENQNIHFLRYYLQSYAAKKIEELSLLGSTIQNLSLYTLNNFSVPLPSEIEQDSIIEYLDKKCTAIDTAIEQKQNLIEKLTEYKKSLIYECVTGKRIV